MELSTYHSPTSLLPTMSVRQYVQMTTRVTVYERENQFIDVSPIMMMMFETLSHGSQLSLIH